MEALECRRLLAGETSMREGCRLCRGVRGEEGIAKLCVKEW